MMANKKREVRRSVQQSGLISLAGGFATRKCVLADLSRSGARLLLDVPTPLQQHFKLSLTGDVRSAFSCELVWQRGKSAGVRFNR
jgi:hypothetical protein